MSQGQGRRRNRFGERSGVPGGIDWVCVLSSLEFAIKTNSAKVLSKTRGGFRAGTNTTITVATPFARVTGQITFGWPYSPGLAARVQSNSQHPTIGANRWEMPACPIAGQSERACSLDGPAIVLQIFTRSAYTD